MSYYVKLDEAREILFGRRQLRAEVEKWWIEEGWGLPPLPKIEQSLALHVPYVATARYEDCVYWLMAIKAGLTPVWPQYNADLHSIRSKAKKGYLAGVFCSGRGRKGGVKADRHEFLRVANHGHAKYEEHKVHQPWIGRPFYEVADPRTGLSLVRLHNEFQSRVLGVGDEFRPDISPWFKRRSVEAGENRASDYYPRYLSMFIAHAVLFEDYHGGESGIVLDDFTSGIFEPAFREVRERFGVSPIIVPLPWWPELAYYPHPDAGDWRSHGIIPPEYF